MSPKRNKTNKTLCLVVFGSFFVVMEKAATAVREEAYFWSTTHTQKQNTDVDSGGEKGSEKDRERELESVRQRQRRRKRRKER
jgi:hypothetical protein